MRIAYLDCFSGISGDMFLGALIDAGVEPQLLHDTVAALNQSGDLGVRLEISRTIRGGISATKVDVLTRGAKDAPRIEHHHYHGHEHGHTHHHAHENVLGAGHDHDSLAQRGPASAQASDALAGVDLKSPGSAVIAPAVAVSGSPTSAGFAPVGAAHRGLTEIRGIIERAAISQSAKARALEIFQRLGAAEAKVHDIPVDQVHFHEVGAADAITDIVCAAVGAEALGADQWVCSPLNLGSGSIECAHGRFPVPAPATAELLKDAPVFSSGLEAELVTPTGAAIATALAGNFSRLPDMKITKIGYGAGSRDFAGHANVLRIMIGEAATSAVDVPGANRETVSVLESSIDDLSPQVLAYAAERLLAEGALDVFTLPAQMKKGRMGSLLKVLARPADSARLAEVIFRETSTLGIRIREEQRVVLSREHISVNTPWGSVRLKAARFQGNEAQVAPEYEDCRRLAEQHHLPLKRVMAEALRCYRAEDAARARRA